MVPVFCKERTIPQLSAEAAQRLLEDNRDQLNRIMAQQKGVPAFEGCEELDRKIAAFAGNINIEAKREIENLGAKLLTQAKHRLAVVQLKLQEGFQGALFLEQDELLSFLHLTPFKIAKVHAVALDAIGAKYTSDAKAFAERLGVYDKSLNDLQLNPNFEELEKRDFSSEYGKFFKEASQLKFRHDKLMELFPLKPLQNPDLILCNDAGIEAKIKNEVKQLFQEISELNSATKLNTTAALDSVKAEFAKAKYSYETVIAGVAKKTFSTIWLLGARTIGPSPF